MIATRDKCHHAMYLGFFPFPILVLCVCDYLQKGKSGEEKGAYKGKGCIPYNKISL